MRNSYVCTPRQLFCANWFPQLLADERYAMIQGRILDLSSRSHASEKVWKGYGILPRSQIQVGESNTHHTGQSDSWFRSFVQQKFNQ